MDTGPAPALLAILVIAAAAAIVCASTDGRLAALATGFVLMAAPVAAGRLPAPQPLAFWLLASLLAVYLLGAAARDEGRLLGRLPLGGAPEAAFAVFALLLGWGVAPVAGPSPAQPQPLAAGACLAVAAVPLVAFSRDALRAAAGSIFAVVAAALVGVGLGAIPVDALAVGTGLVAAASAGAARMLVPLSGRMHGDAAAIGAHPAPPQRPQRHSA